jgi:glycerol-3-phosphate dehydrogenase (NAD(P)+)
MSGTIAVLGAGSWGTALAILIARNGCQTLLWGHQPEHIADLATHRQNQRYLPGMDFPENLWVTSKIAEAAGFSDTLLVCVPSHAFKATLLDFKPYLPESIKIAWATKGFNTDDGALLHDIVAGIFSKATPAAIISGPSFAHEVAANLPTAITVASFQPEFAKQLASVLYSPRFRTYTSSDVIGVEVGGAVKNILAIAAGIADGLGLGANTRAALITRGLTEIMRLGLQLGGKQDTFMGLAGLGDLILTCTDNQSRNRRLGLALGQGHSIAEALAVIGQEVEGVLAAKETVMLARKYHIEMPIIEQTYQVLYEGLDPKVAVENLLARELKPEY